MYTYTVSVPAQFLQGPRRDPERFFVDDVLSPGRRTPLTWYTTLRIDIPATIEECIATLVHATNLQHCRFGNITNETFVMHPTARAALPKLQSLHLAPAVRLRDGEQPLAGLRSDRRTFLCHIFDAIKTPALRQLSVECNAVWRQSSFMALLDASGCRPGALEFKSVHMGEQELLAIMRRLPDLLALKLHAHPVARTHRWGAFMHAISHSHASGILDLVPNLKMLSFNPAALANLRPGKFGALATTRMIGDPAERLAVVWLPVDEEKDTQNLHDIYLLHLAREEELCSKIFVSPEMVTWGTEVRELVWTEDERCIISFPGWVKTGEPGKVYMTYSDMSLEY
ncbi:hypothetical protein HYPSUDRAFT_559268 [Hypholoma sublateritium FD-334 SS-4]|uniref:F-box domain-containing protein n=1 Tax=Hypholoma sublateritium (strain FD-334 SS-4) TaxID=945553 RepID=A0A0D2P5A8_HYPSF|nr:hypothetical protein HYPSUDRAFT_559268 [Hypholoma sublateritium FD-334 SS-4]